MEEKDLKELSDGIKRQIEAFKAGSDKNERLQIMRAVDGDDVRMWYIRRDFDDGYYKSNRSAPLTNVICPACGSRESTLLYSSGNSAAGTTGGYSNEDSQSQCNSCKLVTHYQFRSSWD